MSDHEHEHEAGDAPTLDAPGPSAPAVPGQGESEPEGEAETSELLALVLAPRPARERTIDGIMVGRVLRLTPLCVRFEGAPDEGVVARAFCDPSALAAGGLVALAFEEGRADRPLVMGKMASLEGPAGGGGVDRRAGRWRARRAVGRA
jgi:hypothetical protein